MNLDNVKYASILIKFKKNKAFEFELRNCESVTEVTLQKIIEPLRRKLREAKQTVIAAKDAEIRAAKQKEPAQLELSGDGYGV